MPSNSNKHNNISYEPYTNLSPPKNTASISVSRTKQSDSLIARHIPSGPLYSQNFYSIDSLPGINMTRYPSQSILAPLAIPTANFCSSQREANKSQSVPGKAQTGGAASRTGQNAAMVFCQLNKMSQEDGDRIVGPYSGSARETHFSESMASSAAHRLPGETHPYLSYKVFRNDLVEQARQANEPGLYERSSQDNGMALSSLYNSGHSGFPPSSRMKANRPEKQRQAARSSQSGKKFIKEDGGGQSVVDELRLMEVNFSKNLSSRSQKKSIKANPNIAGDKKKLSNSIIKSNSALLKTTKTAAAKKANSETNREKEKQIFRNNVSPYTSKQRAFGRKFFSLSLEDLFRKKAQVDQDLEEIRSKSGRLIKSAEKGPIKTESLWECVMEEGSKFQKTFFSHINSKARLMKTMGKNIADHKRIKQHRTKKSVLGVERKAKKLAKTIARSVDLGFWKKIKKLREIKSNWIEQERKRDAFKKRLDTFVEQSANRTSQVARKLFDPEEQQQALKSQSDMSKILDSVVKEKNGQALGLKTPCGITIAQCPVRIALPPLLRFGTLRDYQRIGLDWLVTLHENNMNGILADEMGLGKTVQTIALLAHLATSEQNWGPHLLVVPTSVIVNWEMEFKRWLPGFKVVSYYGSPKERKTKRNGWDEPNSFHVLVTSYNLVVTDSKALRRRRWEYLVLDEAHNIKNFQSKKWQTLLGFKSSHRLLLTGTPLQNNIMELWAFLHFIMPDVFVSRIEFTQWFDCPMAELMKRNQSFANSPVIQSLHSVLRPFMLRRLKKEVATQLPQKRELVLKCKLSLRQRRLYEDFMNETSTRDILERENLYGMWSVLMQLRKVCNHPDLFEGRPIHSPFDMGKLDVKMPAAVFSALLKLPFEHVCLDLIRQNWLDEPGEESCDAMRSTHLKDSIDKLAQSEEDFSRAFVEKRQAGVSAGDNEFESLLRGKDAKSLIWLAEDSAESSKKCVDFVRTLEDESVFKASQNTKKTSKTVIYGENLIRMLFLKRALQKEIANSRFLKTAIKLPSRRAKLMAPSIQNFICTNPPARAPVPSLYSESFDESGLGDVCLSDKLNSMAEPFHAAQIRSSMHFPDKRLIQWDCGKLQKLSKLLMAHKKAGDRCLIFTQMTKMLDVLEAFLNIYEYRYFRLDGSTRTDTRGALMQRFNTDQSIFVFILTTRSGGYGINLTGANVVIFYDTDWNPAIDMQAQDRAHRIGQTRKVTIYRLISTNTVEENMLKVAINKRKVNTAVIGDGKFNTENLFQKSEIREMFGLSATTDKNDDADENPEQLMKMMNQAEDQVDQKNLQKAMEEIKAEKMTAKEHTEQLESELTQVELYALNYEKSWVCISGFEGKQHNSYESPACPRARSLKKKKSHPNRAEGKGEKDEEHEDDGRGRRADRKAMKIKIEEEDSLSSQTQFADAGSNVIKPEFTAGSYDDSGGDAEKTVKKFKSEFSSIKSVTQAEEGNIEREEARDGIAPLLCKKFVLLDPEEQSEVIQYYANLFQSKGYHVHKPIINPTSDEFPFNNYEMNSSEEELVNFQKASFNFYHNNGRNSDETMSTNAIIKNSAASKNDKVTDCDRKKTKSHCNNRGGNEKNCIKENWPINGNINAEIKVQNQTEFRDEKQSHYYIRQEIKENAQSIIKVEVEKKFKEKFKENVEENSENTKHLNEKKHKANFYLRKKNVFRSKKAESGSNDSKQTFYNLVFDEDDKDLESLAFDIFFPIEENMEKIEKMVNLLVPKEETDRNGIEYYWKTTPSLPCIDLLKKWKQRDVAQIKKSNSSNRKKNGQKRVIRKNSIQKKAKYKNPAIFARQVIVKIPFKYLRQRYPNGWKTIKKMRRLNFENRRDIVPSPSLLNDLTQIDPKIAEKSQTPFVHKITIAWTKDEDQQLLALSHSLYQNWDVVQQVFSYHPIFRGRLRSANECRKRHIYLCQLPLQFRSRSSEGTEIVRMFEMRKRKVHSAIVSLLDNGESIRESKSVIKNYPVAFGSTEIYCVFDKAVKAVKDHRDACENALNATLKISETDREVENVHKSHESILAEDKRVSGLEEKCGASGSMLMLIAEASIRRKNLNTSKTAIEEHPPPVHTFPNMNPNFKLCDIQSHMKKMALILYNDSQNVVRNNKGNHVQKFVSYFCSLFPKLKLTIKELFCKPISAEEKVRSIAELYLKTCS